MEFATLERIYTTKDAAKLLAYSVRQITQKCADHKIAAYKLPGGRKWLILESEIKRFQENGDRKTVSLSKAMRQHFEKLSIEALTLASNFESYLDDRGFSFPGKLGDIVYGGESGDKTSWRSLGMREVDKSVALNLLQHLKGEFPELANISDWGDLTSSSLSGGFIERLRLKANRGDFIDRCTVCPDC